MNKAIAVAATVLTLAAVAPPAGALQSGAPSPEEQARRRADAEGVRRELMRMPNPIEALHSVWIEELTWIEVRDEIRSGTTTAIIPTGGVEQNGPYLANGKHNYVIQGGCEAVAKELGNALCAPVIKLVPEGDPEHIAYPGTLSLRQETFRMVLEDVGNSLKSQGFTDIILIGDSGGNQQGMEASAGALNERWAGTGARAYYIAEFYNWNELLRYMAEELGYVETVNDGYHDDYAITTLMMLTDPEAVRYHQRVKAGKATINGLSIAPIHQALEVGRRLQAYRVDVTVKAIRAAMSARKGSP